MLDVLENVRSNKILPRLISIAMFVLSRPEQIKTGTET